MIWEFARPKEERAAEWLTQLCWQKSKEQKARDPASAAERTWRQNSKPRDLHKSFATDNTMALIVPARPRLDGRWRRSLAADEVTFRCLGKDDGSSSKMNALGVNARREK